MDERDKEKARVSSTVRYPIELCLWFTFLPWPKQVGDRMGKYCEYCRWEMNLRCEQQNDTFDSTAPRGYVRRGLSCVNNRCIVHRSAMANDQYTENIKKDLKRTINLQYMSINYTHTHKSTQWNQLFHRNRVERKKVNMNQSGPKSK